MVEMYESLGVNCRGLAYVDVFVDGSCSKAALKTEETSLKKKQKEKQKEKEKEKEEAVAEPRPKRNVKVSKMICSPYMEQIAKIKDRVKADELVLCNSIFASKRDTKEKVWENDMGYMLYQSDVYTFKANFYINWRIINCWISIMNARECLKSDESPSRLFLHSDCMADYMLDESLLELTRMNQFNMLFIATCNNLDINPNLRSIGLILMLKLIYNYTRYFSNNKPKAKLLAEAETRNLKNKRKRGGRIGPMNWDFPIGPEHSPPISKEMWKPN
ncbi:hypothetical protein LXL04_028268 [Taraxacum kok-saghyz]